MSLTLERVIALCEEAKQQDTGAEIELPQEYRLTDPNEIDIVEKYRKKFAAPPPKNKH